jgi:hypothetical protein
MKKIAGFIILFLATLPILKATHITHGNMYYEYLGKTNNGDWRYKVSVILYRDCAGSQVNFDNEITIGVYDGVANGDLKQSVAMQNKSKTNIDPIQIGSNFNGYCFEKALYEKEIILPFATNGYFIVWNRCCRPTMNNIVDDNALNLTTFIPSEPNNVAIPFSDVPIFMGRGFDTYISISHKDADGDSIVYSLVTPLQGHLTDNNPTWTAEAKLVSPTNGVRYRSGFSAIQPFGSGALTEVQSAAEMMKIRCDNIGRYLIAFKVSEWRNGKLLSEQVRERMITVLNTMGSTTQVVLEVTAGTKKEILLNWGAIVKNSSIDSFYIERKRKGTTNWSRLLTLDSTQYNYLDSSISYDVTYEYRLNAYTNDGKTVMSNLDEAIVLSWDPSTSIGEIKSNRFIIYPNPTSSRLFISSTQQYSIKRVVITDIQGKTISNNQFTNATLTKGLDISELPKGVYLLKLLDELGSIETQKIIKQ